MVTLPLLYKREDDPPLSGDVRIQSREVSVFEEESAHFGKQSAVIRTILEEEGNGWEVMGRKM